MHFVMKCLRTRKSSCVNARDISPAVYQVLLCCYFPRGGVWYSHPVLARGYPILAWPVYPPSGPDRGNPLLSVPGMGSFTMGRWRYPPPPVN